FILIPVVVGVNIILALRIVRNDPFLHLVLPIAIIFKLATCGLYMYMVHNVLGGGDVDDYFDRGQKIASLYATTGEWQFLVPFWSTNFITMICGALQIVIGPAFSSMSVIFGMLSFWVEFFAYRAFCTAF